MRTDTLNNTRDHAYTHTVLQWGIHSLKHVWQGAIHTLYSKGAHIPCMVLTRGKSHTLLCGKGAYTPYIMWPGGIHTLCYREAYTLYIMWQGGIHTLYYVARQQTHPILCTMNFDGPTFHGLNV